MLQNKQNILLLILLLMIGYNLFTTKSIRTDVKEYKNKIEQSQSKIDSIQKLNSSLNLKIDSVKSNVTFITKEITHIDKNITTLKKQTNEKVNNIDSFTNIELEQFFTNRYNKNLLTK